MEKRKKKRAKDLPFQVIGSILFTLMVIVMVYPFWYVFLVSVSEASAVSRGDIFLIPSGFNLDNYKRILEISGIVRAFFISVARACVGTVITVFFSTMLAYTVTRKELPFRKVIYRITVISMFVSAGLIPWFLTMKAYNLSNTFWLYILPSAVSPYAVILIKTYMETTVPGELEESARVDGAGMFRILWQIVFPVSKPVIAAIAVFTAVGQWNSWQDNFFLVSDSNLRTLQYMLMQYLRQAEMLAQAVQSGDKMIFETIKNKALDPFSIRATISMVTVLPIMCVYPMMQKYFVKGIMMGAIKG